MRACTIFGGLIISPYTLYVLNSHLTKSLVRFVPSSTKPGDESNRHERYTTFFEKYINTANDPKRKNLLQNMIKNFSLD